MHDKNMSADDKKVPPTFRDYVGAVRPLSQRSGRVPPVKVARPAAPAKRPAMSPRPIDIAFERSDAGLTMEAARVGAEPKLCDVTSGTFRVAESLDLHAMTSDEAELALRGFF